MTRTIHYELGGRPVLIHVTAHYEPGEVIETSHFCNRYEAGWEIDAMEVYDTNGNELTDQYTDEALTAIVDNNIEWPSVGSATGSTA